ncbi:CheR family methyltransferase [Pararhodobacter marinus]|uniref:CheR family methyltransferase n=1 Tax=Pararhodobacter marinus TaxID=2184063 RepID=UPI003513F7B5
MSIEGPPILDTGEAQLSEDDFQRIARIAKAGWGLNLDPAKKPLIRSRLGRRLKAVGLTDFKAYCAVIESGDTVESEHFVSALTTNVTHFYRETHHFETIETEFAASLAARAKAGHRIRIWSAGCSSGQEPYSLAASLLAVLPDAARYDVKILATDIDLGVLKTAQSGLYEAKTAAFPTPQLKARVFDPAQEPAARDIAVRPELKALITFRRLNLVQPWPFAGQFQIVMCRNVAIYFDKATQKTLWERFSEVLAPDGLLFIGHSERIPIPPELGLSPIGITSYRKINAKN